MSADVEPGVMQPQTKACRRPPGAGRDKNGSSMAPAEGLWPVKPFWTADLQDNENIVCLCKPPGAWWFVTPAPGL